ncbi:MAG TPA: efflux RND transporter periplasmic adaptor subunit [Casimicrobiaceae bacterium]|nr:efflux RND transporter periplasmic adaptor subunit [Casimicrobiaceae bacterium]
MNKSAIVATAALGIVAAASAGFWVGANRPLTDPTAATAPATKAASAAASAQSGANGAPTTVEATKVAVMAMPQSITAVGSLRSDESITVRPEVAGRISAILFKEGQQVGKGMMLVRLDPAINQAELQQARANLKLAQTKYDRAVELSQRNFISGQAKDEAENNLRVAQAALSLVEARLAKTEIRAPFSGMIGLRVVSVGDYVKEGADIVNLESIDPLKVDFRVPEVYMRQVQEGQTLTVTLDALPGKKFEGKVFAVNPLVDAAGRAVVIRAIVRNTDTSLRPGMFARVNLITRAEKEALVIPEQAIVPQGEEQYVFRVVDGKVARVRVEIGQRREAKVEILKGLAANDVVVTAGQLKLRDGMPVTVIGTNGPASASTPDGKSEVALHVSQRTN